MKHKQSTRTTATTAIPTTSNTSEPDAIALSEYEFRIQFNPLPNLFNPNAPFDWGDGYGTLYETYGEEFSLVRTLPEKHVWTLLNGDKGDLIVNGFHTVNRLGYFVCEHPVPDGVSYEVVLNAAIE